MRSGIITCCLSDNCEPLELLSTFNRSFVPIEFDIADDWGMVSAAKGTLLGTATFSVAWEAAELVGFGFHSLLGITK